MYNHRMGLPVPSLTLKKRPVGLESFLNICLLGICLSRYASCPPEKSENIFRPADTFASW